MKREREEEALAREPLPHPLPPAIDFHYGNLHGFWATQWRRITGEHQKEEEEWELYKAERRAQLAEAIRRAHEGPRDPN